MDKFVRYKKKQYYKLMTVTDQKKKIRKEMLFKRSILSKSTKLKYDNWICHSLLKKIEEYQKERAPELSVLIDRGAWSDAVGITVYPTLVLIGPKGRMLRLWSGTPSMDDVQRSVVAALRLGL